MRMAGMNRDLLSAARPRRAAASPILRLTTAKTATLYRKVMTDRMCPYGLTSKDLLEQQGFHMEDRHLTQP